MSTTNRHISYFKVENFKRFESFEMDNLGQFNLIVGDNNVGKTSVLEALLFSPNQFQTFSNLVGAMKFRKLINRFSTKDFGTYINFNAKSFNNIRSIDVRYKLIGGDLESVNLLFNDNSQQLIFESQAREKIDSMRNENFYRDEAPISSSLNFPFVPFHRGHDEDLTKFYGKLQEDRTLKNQIVRDLKTILPDIENIEPTHRFEVPHLIVYQRHVDPTLPLAMFGDGTIKLFRLLAGIILSKGQRLMIDEVDAGIHYSRMREFWKVIINAAKHNNVQLFMTTHNKECIQAFVEAFSEPELQGLSERVRNITLVETKEKQVKAFTYTFDQLEHAVTVGNEVRS